MKPARRGEVWLADLGLAAKIRPCLVLGAPSADDDRSLVTVVPHTTSLRGTRYEVSVPVRFLRPGAFDAQGIVTLHDPIPQQGQWLRQAVRGYFAYHAVPTNIASLSAFRHHVVDLWRRALKRRSQKDRTTWRRIAALAADFLPVPRILHPWPDARFAVTHPRWEPVRKSRTPGSVRGVLGNGHPYRDTHGRRRKLNDKYDYRYSQLIWVFARLIREGRIREERLAGVSEEKLSYIRRMLQP